MASIKLAQKLKLNTEQVDEGKESETLITYSSLFVVRKKTPKCIPVKGRVELFCIVKTNILSGTH